MASLSHKLQVKRQNRQLLSCYWRVSTAYSRDYYSPGFMTGPQRCQVVSQTDNLMTFQTTLKSSFEKIWSLRAWVDFLMFAQKFKICRSLFDVNFKPKFSLATYFLVSKSIKKFFGGLLIFCLGERFRFNALVWVPADVRLWSNVLELFQAHMT